MRKNFLSVLLTGFVLLPCLLNGHEIKELARSERILIPPSISDNGRCIVYAGIDDKTGSQAIFVSHLKRNGQFSKPTAAIATNSMSKNTGNKLEYIQTYLDPYTATEFRPMGGFDSPMVQDNIITFSATIKNLRRGIFYATQESGKWIVHPIAISGEKIPGSNTVSFKDFNAPYIGVNNRLLFLARGSDNVDYIFSHKINPNGKPAPKNSLLILKSNDRIRNFYDISVSQGNLAFKAEDYNKTNIYSFNTQTGSLKKEVPVTYKGQEKGTITNPMGPSLFAGKVAFSTYTKNEDGTKVYAIYSNAANHDFSKPVISSNKFVDSIKVKLAKVWNPTLFIKNNKAYIVFMGLLKKNTRIAGVYLAEIENGKVKISSIAVPGQRLKDNKIILAAGVGAVSVRNKVIALAMRLNDGKNAIAEVRVN